MYLFGLGLVERGAGVQAGLILIEAGLERLADPPHCFPVDFRSRIHGSLLEGEPFFKTLDDLLDLHEGQCGLR